MITTAATSPQTTVVCLIIQH